jgi:hypothetical protein
MPNIPYIRASTEYRIKNGDKATKNAVITPARAPNIFLAIKKQSGIINTPASTLNDRMATTELPNNAIQ